MILDDPWNSCSRLDRAIVTAVAAHRGQVDKIGLPYVLHPLYVMEQMSTESERIVAVLHDILEDCDETNIEELTLIIPLIEEEATALVALTHKEHEPNVDYIQRIIDAGELAMNVKLQDLFHNSSEKRLRNLPTETIIRLRKKYDSAIDAIREARYNETGEWL